MSSVSFTGSNSFSQYSGVPYGIMEAKAILLVRNEAQSYKRSWFYATSCDARMRVCVYAQLPAYTNSLSSEISWR